jgi:hypothetical protein
METSVIEELRLTAFKTFRDGALSVGSTGIEDVVIRMLGGGLPRPAKALSHWFVPASDYEWQGGRSRNGLMESTWH